MIEMHSENPPIGIWFLALEEKLDVMGCLQRVPGEAASFVYDFRFRYHKDEKVFESEDVKHWYHVEIKTCPTEDDAIAKVRDVMLMMCQMKPWDTPKDKPQLDELLYRDYGDFGKFMQAFQDKPYAFAKMVSEQEAKKYTDLP